MATLLLASVLLMVGAEARARSCVQRPLAEYSVIFDNLLDVPGRVDIHDDRIIVTLDRRAHNRYLGDSG